MDQQRLVDEIVSAVRGDADLRALFLAGSLGRGDGDRFSDVDLVAVVGRAKQEGFGARWRPTFEAITPVVLWYAPRGITTLHSAVTRDWLRCDLYVVAPDGLRGRAKSTLAPLIDPDDLRAALPDNLPPGAPQAARVQGLIEEFIRVLGLLPVAIGRGEHVVATRGAGLLRDKLIDLMLEDAALPGGHGALHLSRLLPPEDMACLAALPPARPDRPDVQAHLATARAFIPRARRMARDLALPWPEAFAAATARHLEAELGVRVGLG